MRISYWLKNLRTGKWERVRKRDYFVYKIAGYGRGFITRKRRK